MKTSLHLVSGLLSGAAVVALAFAGSNCSPSGGSLGGSSGNGSGGFTSSGSGGNSGSNGGNNGNGGSNNGNGGSNTGNGGSNSSGGRSSSNGGANTNGGAVASNGGATPSNGGATATSNGGATPSNGGATATSNGGSTTASSTPTGTTVTFVSGKASGAMVGYGWVASGSLDSVTDPTCGATKAIITTATPCAADPNWSSTSSLCVSGSIPALPAAPTQADYNANYGIVVGVNANDPSGTLGQSFTTMTMAATGLPTGIVRAQVHVKGDPDGTSYCMTYSASAMTLAKFAIDCYATAPTQPIPAASIANIDKVSLEAVSGQTAVTVTSMCITGITFGQ
jgi:hypothetical protein